MTTSATPGGRPAPLGKLGRLGALAVAAFILSRSGPDMGATLGVAPTEGWAPAYFLVTLDGDTVRSSELRGSVVVVNFWATWCAPCRLEMPALEELHQELGDSGLVVLGLSSDVGGEGPIRAFLAEEGITYSVGRATRSHRTAFLGIAGIPVTFVIGRNGIVQDRVVGYFEPERMRAAVDKALATSED